MGLFEAIEPAPGCEECGGDGTEQCWNCAGMGFILYEDDGQELEEPCDECAGTGLTVCEFCQGSGIDVSK